MEILGRASPHGKASFPIQPRYVLISFQAGPSHGRLTVFPNGAFKSVILDLATPVVRGYYLVTALWPAVRRPLLFHKVLSFYLRCDRAYKQRYTRITLRSVNSLSSEDAERTASLPLRGMSFRSFVSVTSQCTLFLVHVEDYQCTCASANRAYSASESQAVKDSFWKHNDTVPKLIMHRAIDNLIAPPATLYFTIT